MQKSEVPIMSFELRLLSHEHKVVLIISLFHKLSLHEVKQTILWVNNFQFDL